MLTNNKEVDDISIAAKFMRRKILEVSHKCNLSTHLGGGLSIVDIVATLYTSILLYKHSDPRWDLRDKFILSKGHGVLGFFSGLLVARIISEEIFFTFQTNGSDLIAHPVMNLDLGIESSNGSLGQGLSMGVGLAIAAKKKKLNNKVYVLLGDGECNEGSIWEAAMSAHQFGLDNLIVIVDKNNFQSDGECMSVMNSISLAEKWRSFGWNTCEVDGHNITELLKVFREPSKSKMPMAIIANTIKGKGVSFMEGNNDWHHNRLTKNQYDLALLEMDS